jgi:hypothetical protein
MKMEAKSQFMTKSDFFLISLIVLGLVYLIFFYTPYLNSLN